MNQVCRPTGPAMPQPSDNRSELVRTYKIWQGSNIFALHGRLIFGPDARSLLLSFLMIVPPVGVFCTFVARKLMDDFPHHWGVSIMVFAIALTVCNVIFLLLTSARDPGIVPRKNHPPESEDLGSRRGRTEEVEVNGMRVQVKYCETCMHYRPPRCSHCSICDNCVERFDHHCPWVGQCIGARNYRFYFLFVSSATALCIYVFAFCWVYVVRIMHGEETTIWKALIKTPASIALIIYCFLLMWFVGGLTVFHSYLISRNQTTYENFRALYDHRANPYNKGVLGNFKEVFFSPIPPSKNKFRAKVQKELDFPSRRVNGSVVNPITGRANMDMEMGMKPSQIEWELDRPMGELGDIKEGSERGSLDGFEKQINDADVMEEPGVEPGVQSR
ncbi:hypothetical protein SAY87_028324 [Trapa incisa]|uniref:S-acyltransferase n=1 Tax=Trapa incisa TaxID=236973 RepID=A0AAN7L1C4_9MYRT|nr:hypothetical protein SAY87_028324 [Trapa incisa]